MADIHDLASYGFDVGGEPIQDPIKEVSVKTDEVKALVQNSLDFLAGLVMPTVFKYCFPSIYKQIFTALIQAANKSRDFTQIAIGLPRGFAKTMLVKLFVIYAILFTKKQFILVICGTQQKAVNIITDIMTMVSENNVLKLFGDWKLGVETDRQDLKRFGFRGRNIILMGAGSGSDIRGITLENERPDVIIFDDIQTREDADSEVVSTNLETWMYGTAMKAKSPHGCLFIFIANMYPTKWSFLRKIKYNSGWTKFIVGGILKDGSSLWEELQPIKQLLQEYQNDLNSGHPEIFFAEVLNDENASVNRVINLNAIHPNPYTDDLIHQGNFIIIDPSNDKATSDNVALGYFEIFDSKPLCKKVISEKMSPGECVRKAILLCLEKSCALVAVESNAYQYSFLYWFDFITAQLGISGITCVDVYSGQRSKNSRILQMFRGLIAKPEPDLYLHQDVRAVVDNEIVTFNPLKVRNVDNILDLLTYPNKVIEQYGEYISSTITIQAQENNAIPLRGAEDTCSF
jgi:hypothetical protein